MTDEELEKIERLKNYIRRTEVDAQTETVKNLIKGGGNGWQQR